MQVLGIAGGETDYDQTFDEWDVDGSGALDFAEIREALIALQKTQGLQLVSSAHETVKLLS